ncbi:Ig-like domain-containing protein [Myxacorys almedinensis]|uniref:SbsA Ig-like domain-containing protein n=1 Tax=Myxacorys almedinensis A TaxID=2690445 RepID=A0A8J8CME3_9CYAN|nr:Ig-like domain-containing protein [Myxacorys almedinensis]NDJ17162.1 hypothetical protein [Myxacorys almedinensis A]
MMQTPSAPRKQFFQPLDRAALGLTAVLAVLIGILLINGDRSAPQIREFTWQDKQIGAGDKAFVLTFSRPMDHASVEQNLRINPSLPGKVSWAGRRLAYTLNQPAPYGTNYQVSLQDARDRFTPEGANRATLQSFVGNFRTRDRAFAYIGVEGDEAERLILYNMTREEKKVLTPPSLMVMDFKPYPNSDRILFSAVEKTSQSQSLIEQKLYTVTTGLQVDAPQPLGDEQGLQLFSAEAPATPSGQVTEILDNRNYQNLKFDLSANGDVIVVQRINRADPNDSGPWVIRGSGKAESLDNKQPGGDFLITPDSTSLAIAQGQGLAILPLQPQADPLDFLPKFGNVLSFANDGTAAAMVKFNTDYTRSLFLVTNQGDPKEIFKTTGSIQAAQFDSTQQILYCLLTNLIPGKTYQEQPYLAAIDLKGAIKGGKPEQTLHPLVLLPNQRDIQMTVAPDGSSLLFDQTQPTEGASGSAIATSRLWLLPLSSDFNAKLQPETLPFSGFYPRWLP